MKYWSLVNFHSVNKLPDTTIKIDGRGCFLKKEVLFFKPDRQKPGMNRRFLYQIISQYKSFRTANILGTR